MYVWVHFCFQISAIGAFNDTGYKKRHELLMELTVRC